MDANNTALTTIGLLEARLLRIEHLLYGSSASPARLPGTSTSTVDSLADLERRFSSLISRVRVYAELLKIYKTHPSLFQSPPPSQPPTQLTAESVRSTVLSFASSFPSTASALTAATGDSPIPDPALSASLVALLPRMEGIEAVQEAQDGEIVELRARSEKLVRSWYESRVLGYSDFVAAIESRVERADRGIRRMENAREREVGGA